MQQGARGDARRSAMANLVQLGEAYRAGGMVDFGCGTTRLFSGQAGRGRYDGDRSNR